MPASSSCSVTSSQRQTNCFMLAAAPSIAARRKLAAQARHRTARLAALEDHRALQWVVQALGQVDGERRGPAATTVEARANHALLIDEPGLRKQLGAVLVGDHAAFGVDQH